MLYSSAGILAIVITLIINYDILLNRGIIQVKEQYRIYRQYLLSVFVYYIMDILWGVLYEHQLSQLAFIDTAVYFLAMACSVLMWTRFVVSYLKEEKTWKAYITFGWAYMCFTTIMVGVNFFKPVFFTIDDVNGYQTGVVRYIVIIVQIIMFIITGAITLLAGARNKGTDRVSYYSIGVSSLIMACFIMAQYSYPLLPLYAIGSMIACCILHSFVLEKERIEIHTRLKEEQIEKTRLEKELESQSNIAEIMSSMSSLLTNMPAMTFSKDVETGEYLACNQAFADYTGKKSPDEIVGKTDYDLYDKEAADHFREVDQKTVEMNKPYILFEEVTDKATSSIKNLQTTKLLFRDAEGRRCILGLCVDVTESAKAKAEQAATEARKQEIQKKNEMEENYKKHVKELNYSASHDELTGIYNRFGYNRILKNFDLSECYFIVIDTDNFKQVNDRYGHEMGDRVLKKITDVLKSNFRSGDYIFRVGGDEFVVVMTHAGEKLKNLVATKIERINRELADESDGVPAVSISAGVVHGKDASSDTELFRIADEAMYKAKKSGKSRCTFA